MSLVNIGIILLIILVAFLMISFFYKDRISQQKFAILKILIALTGGFAGGMLAGEAAVNISGTISDALQVAVSGTSGMALFFAIWFYFPKFSQDPPEDSFNFSVPENWTFRQTIKAIVKTTKSLVEIKGFSEEELTIILESKELHFNSVLEALRNIRLLGNKTIPTYSVKFENNIYSIIKDN